MIIIDCTYFGQAKNYVGEVKIIYLPHMVS